MTPQNADITVAHDLLHRMNLILGIQGEAAWVYRNNFKTKTHATGIVTTVYRPELDSRHAAEYHRRWMSVHDANNFGSGFVDLTMNASFIGRFEAGLSFQALPIQIGQDDIVGFGKEKPGLLGPSPP